MFGSGHSFGSEFPKMPRYVRVLVRVMVLLERWPPSTSALRRTARLSTLVVLNLLPHYLSRSDTRSKRVAQRIWEGTYTFSLILVLASRTQVGRRLIAAGLFNEDKESSRIMGIYLAHNARVGKSQ